MLGGFLDVMTLLVYMLLETIHLSNVILLLVEIICPTRRCVQLSREVYWKVLCNKAVSEMAIHLFGELKVKMFVLFCIKPIGY